MQVPAASPGPVEAWTLLKALAHGFTQAILAARSTQTTSRQPSLSMAATMAALRMTFLLQRVVAASTPSLVAALVAPLRALVGQGVLQALLRPAHPAQPHLQPRQVLRQMVFRQVLQLGCLAALGLLSLQLILQALPVCLDLVEPHGPQAHHLQNVTSKREPIFHIVTRLATAMAAMAIATILAIMAS